MFYQHLTHRLVLSFVLTVVQLFFSLDSTIMSVLGVFFSIIRMSVTISFERIWLSFFMLFWYFPCTMPLSWCRVSPDVLWSFHSHSSCVYHELVLMHRSFSVFEQQFAEILMLLCAFNTSNADILMTRLLFVAWFSLPVLVIVRSPTSW